MHQEKVVTADKLREEGVKRFNKKAFTTTLFTLPASCFDGHTRVHTYSLSIEMRAALSIPFPATFAQPLFPGSDDHD